MRLLNVTLVGETSLVGRITALPVGVKASLSKTVQEYVLKLQAHVVADKLSGQVLGVRTGDLRRSIQQRVETTDTTVFGYVFSSGDVKYAAFWEFGFHGTEAVKAYERRATMVFGRAVAPFTQQVSAHTRTVNQEARPYLRPALADMSDQIRQAMIDSVRDGLRAQVMK